MMVVVMTMMMKMMPDCGGYANQECKNDETRKKLIDNITFEEV